jgi:hypothetical protein
VGGGAVKGICSLIFLAQMLATFYQNVPLLSEVYFAGFCVRDNSSFKLKQCNFYAVVYVFQALCYKAEGRGLNS